MCNSIFGMCRFGMAPGVLALLLALAGCGTNVVDRTVSGGLIGAGSGAAMGAVVGNPAAGAVIGGVAGAVTGAVTTGTGPNLGKPIWR